MKAPKKPPVNSSSSESAGASKAPRWTGGPKFEDALEAGDTFTLTIGKEVFSPVKYNTFEVGPISATVQLRQGETVEQLVMRAHHFLDVLFEAEFELKRKQFRERLGESGAVE